MRNVGLLFLLAILFAPVSTHSQTGENLSLDVIEARVDSMTLVRDSLIRRIEEINSSIEKLRGLGRNTLSKDELTQLAEQIRVSVFMTDALGERREYYHPPYEFRPDSLSIMRTETGEIELHCSMFDTIPSPSYWENKRGKNKFYYSYWRLYDALALPTKGPVEALFNQYPSLSRAKFSYYASWFDFNEFGQRIHFQSHKRYEITVTKKLSDKLNYDYFDNFDFLTDFPTTSEARALWKTLRPTIQSVWFERKVRDQLRSAGISM